MVIVSATASLAGAFCAVMLLCSFRQLLCVSLGVSQVLPDLVPLLLLLFASCAVGVLTAVGCSCLPVVSMLRNDPFEAIKRGGTS